ncbi:MAG: sugar ABC transporter substrate-binding protein, partial [Comamonadaceae bacterium]|nr:sugar ABC transporter substrate-binding protein [Comamonadaceae bacterium]
MTAAQSVVFINPGQSDEAYWVAASNAMHKAAKSLDMQLQVIYGERNRLAPIAIAQQLAQLPVAQRPDYVIFSNDYNVAASILRALEGSGIQAFMSFSGRQTSDAQIGKPRERFAFWLGSLEPQAEDAGYLTAK